MNTKSVPTGMSAPTKAPTDPLVFNHWLGNLLSFTAGFVDTCGFVGLFGLFTAHVTGNFILIGASMAGHGHASVLSKVLALPVFIATVAVSRLYQIKSTASRHHVGRTMLRTELFFLVAFMVAALLFGPFTGASQWTPAFVGMLGVIAMSIQNTAGRSVHSTLAPSTVMTGNVTQMAMDVVDVVTRSADAVPAGARIRKNWRPIAAFTIGALGGGLGFSQLGFWALLVPCFALSLALRISSGE